MSFFFFSLLFSFGSFLFSFSVSFSVTAGVSRNTVSGWETGRYEPTNRRWHRICELAGQSDAGKIYLRFQTLAGVYMWEAKNGRPIFTEKDVRNMAVTMNVIKRTLSVGISRGD